MKSLLLRFFTVAILLASTPTSRLIAHSIEDRTKDHQTGSQLFESPTAIHSLHLTLSKESFAEMEPPPFNPFGAPGFGPPGFGPPGGEKSTNEANTEVHRNTFGVPFRWTHGDLVADEKPFPNVGLRYKGNFTFMATNGSLKKSFKLDLNRHAKGQNIDGLTMLNLHCGVSDSTLSRETLSCLFFRDVGVPAPRTTFAELFLTIPDQYEKEYVGLYTVTEQVNKEFLLRHYGDASGMLLKPEGLQEGPRYLGAQWDGYEKAYRPERTTTEEQRQRLIDFTKLVTDGTDEEFKNRIGNFLDIDAFLRFIAANTLLSNLDSYLGFGHNYYLYLNPTSNRFVFIPWDLDLSLATWPAVGTPEQLVELSIEHPHAGNNRLLDRILAIEELHGRYIAMLKAMLEEQFASGKTIKSIDAIESAIEDSLKREKEAIKKRDEGRNGGGFGMPMVGAQFGQSLPPRMFFERRTQSVTDQLNNKTEGFVPKPFGFGFGGPGFGPPPPPAR